MWNDNGGLMWDDSYEIGVELIDQQHKDLFANATEGLLTSIQSPHEYGHKQSCINTIGFLKDYVVRHFNDEEAYQQSINYPELEAHKEQHARLAQELSQYEKRLVTSNFSVPMMKLFMAFVVRWLMKHVAEEDRKIATTGGKNAAPAK